MRSAFAVALVALGGAAVALAQSKELAPIKGSAKSGTTASAGASPAKELDASKEAQLGDLVFRAPLVPGSTDALPAPICINGVCKDPICRYRAKDATATSWPAWGYGETLTKVEVGADTTDEDLPHLGRGEKGRRFGGADYYESATVDNCQIGTEDIVVEIVTRHGLGSSYTFQAATTSSATATGWYAFDESVGTYAGLGLVAGGAPSYTQVAMRSGTLSHVLTGVDRDYASATYGGRTAVNGVSAASADLSARAASLVSGTKFALGAASTGTLATSGSLIYIAIYKQSDWLPGTAANATILDALAADRSARFWGTREEVNGIVPTMTAVGPRCAWTPSNKLDCYSASAPIVGAKWPASHGSIGGLTGGLLVHAQLAQVLLQSRNLTASWTQVGAGTVATFSDSPFVDARQAYQVVDDQAGSEEYIYQDIDITALATGARINVCPWVSTASGTQDYTITVTEQTGCAGSTTHYTDTANASWRLKTHTHVLADGTCTSARITLRPYNYATGAAATGAVGAMINAYPAVNGYNGCPPTFVETTTAAVTPSPGPLRYDVTYSAALGERQVTDASSYVPKRRVWTADFAAPYANLAVDREPGGTDSILGSSAGYLIYQSYARQLYAYDSGVKWSCTNTASHSGFVQAMLSFDYSRDLYTTAYNGKTCQSTTADSGLGATSFPYFYVGNFVNPASSLGITGHVLRNVEVYR